MDENRNPQQPKKGNGKKPRNKQSLFMFLMTCSIIMLAWTYFGENGMNSSSKEITYTEFGVSYTTSIDIAVVDSWLVDFEYTDNGDGTYTIVDWKGTLDGEVSTELIVPDSNTIYI